MSNTPMKNTVLSIKPNLQLRQIIILVCASSMLLLSGCSSIPFIGKKDKSEIEVAKKPAEKKEQKQAPVDIGSDYKGEGEAYTRAEQYKRVTNPKLLNSEYFLNEAKAGGHRGAAQRQAEKDKEAKELTDLKDEVRELKEAVISLKGGETQGGVDYRLQPASVSNNKNSAGGNACRKEDVNYYLDKGFTTEQITQICSGAVN